MKKIMLLLVPISAFAMDSSSDGNIQSELFKVREELNLLRDTVAKICRCLQGIVDKDDKSVQGELEELTSYAEAIQAEAEEAQWARVEAIGKMLNG
jgi:hypothetical protein